MENIKEMFYKVFCREIEDEMRLDFEKLEKVFNKIIVMLKPEDRKHIVEYLSLREKTINKLKIENFIEGFKVAVKLMLKD